MYLFIVTFENNNYFLNIIKMVLCVWGCIWLYNLSNCLRFKKQQHENIETPQQPDEWKIEKVDKLVLTFLLLEFVPEVFIPTQA